MTLRGFVTFVSLRFAGLVSPAVWTSSPLRQRTRSVASHSYLFFVLCFQLESFSVVFVLKYPTISLNFSWLSLQRLSLFSLRYFRNLSTVSGLPEIGLSEEGSVAMLVVNTNDFRPNVPKSARAARPVRREYDAILEI